MQPLLACVFFSLFFQIHDEAPVVARVRVVWGQGEKISDSGALEGDSQRAVSQQLGDNVRVGFHYQQFHVFYVDLWTWDGKHVLYNGDKYWELPEEEWRSLLGHSAADKFSTPFLYRCPLVFPLAVLAVVAWPIKTRLFPDDFTQLQRLLKDPRYIASLEIALPQDGYPLRSQFDQSQYDAALTHLTASRIPEREARRGLDRVLQRECTVRRLQVDEEIEAASASFDAGNRSHSREILERLSRSLPPSDPRSDEVESLLDAFNRIPETDEKAGADSSAEENGSSEQQTRPQH